MTPTASPRPPANKWLVTVSITFGTLMGAIDASIVNVALPHIRGSVGATMQEITWIATGYAIALVIIMPLTAFLGRLFGQKRVYLVSLLLFIAGSALCGTASTLATLVVFRVLQGIGAGALQPTDGRWVARSGCRSSRRSCRITAPWHRRALPSNSARPDPR